MGKIKKLYGRWGSMRQKVINPHSDMYPSHGGRGIRCCERWSRFQNFMDDMGPTWKEGLFLDRIDLDGDFTPENCRWSTKEVIDRRRYNAVPIEGAGGRSLQQLSDESGVNYCTLRQRLMKGIPLAEALVPAGEASDSIAYKARQHGIDPRVVHNRIRYGWTLEKALNTPVRRRK